MDSLGNHTTLVLEGNSEKHARLRRPVDLLRFALVVASIVAVAFLAYFASRTTSGIDQDITHGASRLPRQLVFLANLVSGFGALLLPVVSGLDLVVRRRGRQLLEAIAALFITILILIAASWAIGKFGSDRLLLAFAGTTKAEEAASFNSVVGGLSAFVTVSRLMSRSPLNISSVVVITSIALANIIGGGITAAGLTVSLLTGWGIGLLTRYILGTETTRPPGSAIAATLAGIHYQLNWLRPAEYLDAGRRYDATTTDGQRLDLVVIDRDLENAGIAAALWRSIRLRDDTGSARSSMRRRLERSALNSWAISTAGINTPFLLAATEVGPDASVLVYNHVGGRRFSQIDHALGDAELANAWEVARDLQAARIAHRRLTADSLLLGNDGKVYVTDLEEGAIAASDVLLRIDLAEMMVTLAHLAGAKRAVEAGRVVLRDDVLARALPALQPVAFSAETRALVKDNKDLLADIREELLAISPNEIVEDIEIERLKPKMLITIAAGTVAAYVVMTQLGQVNLIELLKSADKKWMLIGLVLSAGTYAAATTALLGVIPERINFWKAFQAQWAASFATLVAPPTLGSVAINVRFLTASGLTSALAATSVAVAQVLAFFSHIGLLLIAVVAAGTSSDFTFRPPRSVIVGVVVLALVLSFLLTIPFIRAKVLDRVKPIIDSVVPRISSLIHQPGKIAAGFGGVIALNMFYIGCLFACVHAFDAKIAIASVAVVYLAGSVVGTAAPTPGGLGAVEAAVAAGLTAIGVDGGVAVSATLLFRVLTFWIPVFPGWLAFNHLQKTGDL